MSDEIALGDNPNAIPHRKVHFSGEVWLDADEVFRLLVSLCRQRPEVVERVLAHVRAGKKIACPFPGDCAEFPCETLLCNADCCSNAHAYRMS